MGEPRRRKKSAALFVEEKRSPPNWLQWLDQSAMALPPAETWLQPYDYFYLIRYPQLQPRDPVGKKTCEELLRKQEEQISTHTKTRQALRNLSPARSREVAALVFDWTVHFREHVKWKTYDTEIEPRARQAKCLKRALESYKRTARKSLEKFVRATSQLHPMLAGEEIRAALERVQEQIDAVGLPLPSSNPWAFRDSSYYQMYADDRTSPAMAQLFWLFHHGCELSVGESEVRVALIRNHLWSDYADPVECAIRKSEESKGCDAVRKAVERYRLPEGTK